MTHGQKHPTFEVLSQAPADWLSLVAQLMPETVKIEFSSYLLIVALVALWIWLHPPRGGA
jgi:hypothetical protein